MRNKYLFILIFFGFSLLVSLLNASWFTRLLPDRNAKQDDALQVHPVPEFAKVSSLMLSEDLINYYEEGIALLRKSLELDINVLVLSEEEQTPLEARSWYQNLVPDIEHKTNQIKIINIPHDSIWIRDFGPAFARWLGKPAINKLSFVDFIYRSDVIINDTVPYMSALYLHKSLESIPVILDGGSFISNGRSCLVSVDSLDADNLLQFRYIKGKPSISLFRSYLKHFVGCEQVLLFPKPAHEHIDMWAKFIDPNTVLVNELREDILNAVQQKHGPLDPEVGQIKSKLDAAASALKPYFNVIRIPMPIPEIEIFRTYANALLINHDVLIPSYSKTDLNGASLLDADYLDAYEQEVANIFEVHNYRVSFIKADQIISEGGSLHCVGLQLPE